jgi:hypothetical protein
MGHHQGFWGVHPIADASSQPYFNEMKKSVLRIPSKWFAGESSFSLVGGEMSSRVNTYMVGCAIGSL